MMINSNRGVALIAVLGVLAVLAAIGATFTYNMRLEEKAAANYLNEVKARYIAEAGIARAIAELKAITDSYTCETQWRSIFKTTEPWVDMDGDGTYDASWIFIKNSSGQLIGRYAVVIEDEGGKININTSGNRQNQGWSPFEVSFKNFLDAGHNNLGWSFGASTTAQLADNLIRYREGANPGTSIDDDEDSSIVGNDGIDNDADGTVDESGEGVNEPDEFVPWNPYQTAGGDRADTPYITIAQIKEADGIDTGIFNQIKPYITVYSSDKNTDASGFNRLDINVVNEASALYSILKGRVSNPEQIAANIIDYRDKNNASTPLTIGTKTVYGVEGVKINEIMVKPIYKLEAEDASDSNLTVANGENGTNWVEDASNTYFRVVDDGAVAWWEWDKLPPGQSFKVIIYSRPPPSNGTIDVSLDGSTWTLALDPDPITGKIDTGLIVTSDATNGKVRVYLRDNNGSDPGQDGEICTFDYLLLSQQPDCEYVELVKITPEPVNLNNWSIKFPGYGVGTIYMSGDWSDTYLVLAVDKDDASGSGVDGNGISFKDTWPAVNLNKVIQLSFSNTPNEYSDVLDDEVSLDNPIILYDGPLATGNIVDQVEYDSDLVQYYKSFEKDDPAYIGVELSEDGIADSWLVCENSAGGTPAADNSRLSPGKVPGIDIKIKNKPYATIGELMEISSGDTEWDKMDKNDLMKIADKVTLADKRLEAENHRTSGTNWTLINAPGEGFLTSYYTLESSLGDTDIWQWGLNDRISPDTGIYTLYIIGKEGREFTVTPTTASKTYPGLKLIPGPDGVARYGNIEICGPLTSGSNNYLRLEMANYKGTGEENRAYFDAIILAPTPRTYGRININTASKEVLQALPGITSSVADAIINYRENTEPFGRNSAGDAPGIGQILKVGSVTGDIFSKISNLITVRSDVFKIICLAQAYDKAGKIAAEKKIEAVIER